MRTAIIFSAVLHVALFLVAIVGLPRPEKRMAAMPEPIPVEIVDIGQLTNTRVEKTPEPPKPTPARPTPAPPRTQPPPPPPQARAEPPPPPPVRAPEPPPRQVAEAPRPEPTPEPAPRQPEPKPEPPKPEPPKPEPPKPEPKKPEPKPEPKKPDPPKPEPKREEPRRSFDNVLKNLEKLREETPTPPAPPQDQPQTAEAPSQSTSRSDRLTISQIDAVRRAIMPCWNVDAGARNFENYLVVVEANMNPDGTVRDARVVSTNVDRANTDRALRALLNPRCQPFPLPADQYSEWRVMTVNFSPRDML